MRRGFITSASRAMAPAVCLGMLGASAGPGSAGPEDPEIVYRSAVLERTAGEPNVYRARFEPCDPTGRFRLVLDNGVEGGRRVSSGVVSLNGARVIEERDFNQQVVRIARPVPLQAANTLEVRLAGAPGGRVRVTVDGFMTCLRVRITSPLAGSRIADHHALVEGELESRGPAGVRLSAFLPIQGHAIEFVVPAQFDGHRFAARAPLTTGEVRIVARASNAAGRTAEDAVTVRAEPDPDALRMEWPEVSPKTGFAPLAVTFDIRGVDPSDLSRLDLDADGDGVPDFTLASFVNSRNVTFEYRVERLYMATVQVGDPAGQSATFRIPISVIPRPDLPALWTDFRAALARGDLDGALWFVADEARDRYRRVFEDLRADLPAVAASLQDLGTPVLRSGYASAGVTRIRDGQTEAFVVAFVRDTDGVWRIASM